jgi:competence protein ComEA
MKRHLAWIAAALPLAALATVNVNTAQQSDLQRTKGLDKHKAKAIIEYRAQHGPIENFEELEKIPGFTPDVIAKVKTEVAFSGDAFVPPPKPEKKPAAPAKPKS